MNYDDFDLDGPSENDRSSYPNQNGRPSENQTPPSYKPNNYERPAPEKSYGGNNEQRPPASQPPYQPRREPPPVYNREEQPARQEVQSRDNSQDQRPQRPAGNASYGSNGGGQQNSYQKKPFNGGGGGAGGFNRGGFKGPREDPELYKIYKPYAVTSNRDVPPEIASRMADIAKKLEEQGYTLRTGGMDGLEELFDKATEAKEVHLPWRGFNDRESNFSFSVPQAAVLARQHHPTYETLKPAVQAFLNKNARLLLGKEMKSPALFLICWSDDGAESVQARTARTGPAGHAIAIAATLRIPIFNFGNKQAEDRLHRYLDIGKESVSPS